MTDFKEIKDSENNIESFIKTINLLIDKKNDASQNDPSGKGGKSGLTCNTGVQSS